MGQPVNVAREAGGEVGATPAGLQSEEAAVDITLSLWWGGWPAAPTVV